MQTRAVAYVRVSTESQAEDGKASLIEQLAEIERLCDRREITIVKSWSDSQRYRATMPPKRGKVVTPSGERSDRPGFQQMLERVQKGDIDIIICWREDRLMRHPRVNLAIEDVLDTADQKRQGLRPVKVMDATGAIFDRFTMRIKAAVWQEENQRRVERSLMGKLAKLKAGYWPGKYGRLGYAIEKTDGGNKIILGDREEIKTVELIFTLADDGMNKGEIRRRLIAEGRQQKGNVNQRYVWSRQTIHDILTAPDYTGAATWNHNGHSVPVEIPQIIPQKLFDRVQRRLSENDFFDSAPALDKAIGMLDGLLVCGECGLKVGTRTNKGHRKKKNGEWKFYPYPHPYYLYRCISANKYQHEHPKPSNWTGLRLDSEVWQFLVDRVIVNRELFLEQIAAEHERLEQDGRELEDKIAEYQSRLADLDNQQLMLGRKLAQGKMDESIYDTLVDENRQTKGDVSEQLDYYRTLYQNRLKLQKSRDYAAEVLKNIETKIPRINHSFHELKALSLKERNRLNQERQEIFRSLCSRVIIFADGHIKMEGLIDAEAMSQKEGSSTTARWASPPKNQTCARVSS